jgi:hypothetical protein
MMPLIMEDDDQDQLMEDLFGESEHVPITITAAPPAKGLPQRLDRLAASNCCQCVCQTFLFQTSPSNRLQGKLLGLDSAASLP